MKMQTRMVSDMKPEDIKAEILKKGLNQAAIARAVGVRSSVVSDCIHGWVTSRRVHEAIAEAINKDVKTIWPSIYLYGIPRRGRPRIEWVRGSA